MKIAITTALSLILIQSTFIPLSHAETPNCAIEMEIKGSSIAECKESAKQYSDDKYGSCTGVTSWMVQWSGLESECNRRVMDNELDRRLLKLKADPAPVSKTEFQKEMKLQKAFLKGVLAHCNFTYKKCEGTMWNAPRAGCPGGIYAIRAAQAILINKGELALPEVNKDFHRYKKSIPTSYKDYAKLLCEMPVDVWKDGVVPQNCQDRALANLNFTSDGSCEE